MGTFRVSEAEAARDLAGLLARVRAGEEVVIESGSDMIAMTRKPVPPPRTIEEVLARMPDDDSMRMGADFADDVESGIASLREPLNPPNWD
ncbi:MAG TPA: hypothetical protein VG267_11480 [Terracidiphilus sp.]|jgi:antitoxin (DNA-binding transcriptional repressor) of toxin-antitoxin stability system|nr:hypothetical protein [Terracidiphilus sp.]